MNHLFTTSDSECVSNKDLLCLTVLKFVFLSGPILKTVKARSDTAAATGHAHIDIAQFLSHCTTKIRLLFLHYCKAGFLN